jgi:DtxR family manganese transport transcriptional regulator
VKARHQTVVAFLVAIGVPDPIAEADAEGIEHHVSDETLAAFERFLAEKSRRR